MTTTPDGAADPRAAVYAACRARLLAAVTPIQMPLPPSEVPLRYRDVTLDMLPPGALRDVAVRYGRGFWALAARGLAPAFFGVSGTWKTSAAGLLAETLRTVFRLPVAWCNCGEEIKTFDRMTFAPSTQARIEALKGAPFLVMDDVLQAAAGRQLDLVLEIGNARFDAMRPTLYTANIQFTKADRTALEQAVGVGFARRLRDGAEGFTAVVRPRPA